MELRIDSMNQENYLKLVDYVEKAPKHTVGHRTHEIYEIKGKISTLSGRTTYEKVKIKIDLPISVRKELAESVKGLIDLLLNVEVG